MKSKKRYHISGKVTKKFKKKKKEFVIMTSEGKVITRDVPPEGYAIEKPRNRSHFFNNFFKKVKRPYLSLLQKKAKANCTIVDIDEEKNIKLEHAMMLRDNVILRVILKAFIEALNVCPNDCINTLNNIYEVVMMDIPNPQNLINSINKQNQEEEIENESLKRFLGTSVSNMLLDIRKGFKYLQAKENHRNNTRHRHDFSKDFKRMRTAVLLKYLDSTEDQGVKIDDLGITSSESLKENSSEKKNEFGKENQTGKEEPKCSELIIVEGFKTIDESQIIYNEVQIEEQCENYFKKLDPLFQQSMRSSWSEISKEIEKSDKEVFITFRDKNKNKEMKGLAVLTIRQSKCEILHLSTLNKADFVNACSMVCNYSQNNSVINSVFISIFYLKEIIDGKIRMKMPEFFKKKLKELGFAWSSLQNKENGKRISIYQLKTKKEVNEPSKCTLMRLNTAKIQASKVFFHHVLIASDFTPDVSGLNQVKGKFECSLGEILCLRTYLGIKNHNEFKDWAKDKVKEENNIKLSQEELATLPYNQFDLKNFKEISKQFSVFTQRQKQRFDVVPNFLASKTMSFKCIHEIDLKYARPATHKIGGVNYGYLRISFNEKVFWMKNSVLKNNIILAPTTNERYLYFFVNFPEGSKELSCSSNEEFRVNLRNLFKNLERQENWKGKDLWVPNFIFSSMDNDISDLIVGEVKDKPKILSLINVELKGYHEGELIQRTPNEHSIIVTKQFVFGLIDTKLEESTEVPFLSCLISKDNFLTVEKTS